MNPVAAKGFHAEAEAYEKGRPDYSHEVIDFLKKEFSLGPDKKLLDLAAGTGKFTRLIRKTGAQILALEPVSGMREQFKTKIPDLEVMDGSAEKIPLPDDSVDVVTVAQAFHWFSNEKALAEIHRVLKPKGHLALIWNVRDENVTWVKEMSDLIHSQENGVPQYRHGTWKDVFAKTKFFSPLIRTEFRHVQQANVDTLVDRAVSTSYVGALPAEEKKALLQQIRDLADRFPELKNKKNFDFPHTTDVFVAQKI